MKGISLLIIALIPSIAFSQTISSYGNPIGLEHNLLFKANERFTVTMTGPTGISIQSLFDGSFAIDATNEGISLSNPLVVEIEGLPNISAWHSYVGWTTRTGGGWTPRRYKIEGYSSNSQTWVSFIDYTNTDSTVSTLLVEIPNQKFTSLRYTFYESSTTSHGKIRLSELFFIHPEGVSSMYQGLFTGGSSTGFWVENGGQINYSNGSVSVGDLTVPNGYLLAVDGKAIVEEVKVQLSENWPDFVFMNDYELRTLEEVAEHITEKGHLPEIPSEAEVAENGINLGEMNAKLLQKIEELTLYMIEMNKRVGQLEQENAELKKEVSTLKNE